MNRAQVIVEMRRYALELLDAFAAHDVELPPTADDYRAFLASTPHADLVALSDQMEAAIRDYKAIVAEMRR